MPLLILFVVTPLVELYTLIAVGSRIGALSTILLCLLTAVIGAFMIRRQGLATINKMQNAMANGEVPATEMLHGALLLVCGMLMLTPGFVTDFFGFLLLVPMIRWALIGFGVSRFNVVGTGESSESIFESQDVNVIEGDFEEIKDDSK